MAGNERTSWPGWRGVGVVVLAGLVGCGGDDPAIAPPASRPAASRPAPTGTAQDHLQRAQTLLRGHHIRDALQALDTALALEPVHRAARVRKAFVLRRLARLDECIAILESLARDFPDDAEIRRHHAEALCDTGHYERAAVLFATLPQSEAARPATKQSYAEALAQSGRLDAAIDVVSSVLIADPWFTDAYLQLAQLLARRGNRAWADTLLARYRADDAIRDAQTRALRMEHAGQRPAALHARGQALLEAGRFYAALMQFNAAIKADPGFGRAYLALGRLSRRLERPDDAISVLGRLPKHADVSGTLGDIYAAAERFPEADASYAEAIRLGGDETVWRERRAALPARQQAASSPAEEPLVVGRRRIRDRMAGKRLSAVVPELLALASLYADHGEGDTARGLALLAARLRPRDLSVRHALPRFFRRREDAFVRCWNSRGTLELVPDDAAATRELVAAYAAIGMQLDAAEPLARQLAARDGSARNLVLLARVLLAKGQREPAEQQIRAALQIDAENKEAQALLESLP